MWQRHFVWGKVTVEVEQTAGLQFTNHCTRTVEIEMSSQNLPKVHVTMFNGSSPKNKTGAPMSLAKIIQVVFVKNSSSVEVNRSYPYTGMLWFNIPWSHLSLLLATSYVYVDCDFLTRLRQHAAMETAFLTFQWIWTQIKAVICSRHESRLVDAHKFLDFSNRLTFSGSANSRVITVLKRMLALGSRHS